MTSPSAAFAQPEYRVEGAQKVTGAARFAADKQVPDMLWAKFLSSPYPSARIVSIDTSAAAAMPGIRAVLTGEDVRGARFGRALQDWPVLAWDVVRFAGERVAAVAAETPEAADAALRTIEVEYEELPAVFEPEAALAPDAPTLHPAAEAASYHFLPGKRGPLPHPNLQGRVLSQTGDADVEAIFARPDVRVFEDTYVTPRQHQGYIEPHACLVWIDESPEHTVHVVSTNKSPFLLRNQMAACIGLPPDRIVVDAEFIGGDFGGKGTSFDEYACFYLARATGRAVRSVMTYIDELQAANPRHSASIHLKTAVDSDGRFVAHRADVLFNGGAYAAGKPLPSLVLEGDIGALAPYVIPHRRVEVQAVYTNTVPGGHQRAPGEVQGVFAGESHVDSIARELNMDPLEFRLRNVARAGQTGGGVGGVGGNYREQRGADVLEALKRESKWGLSQLPPNHGRGVALAVRENHGGNTAVDLRLLAGGVVELITGLPDQGAGSYTLFRRLASHALSIEPSRIRVVHAQTNVAGFDLGAGGSRVTWIVGQATSAAARALRERLEHLAAEVLGWPEGQVHLEHDRFSAGDQTASFEDVADRLTSGPAIVERGSFSGGVHPPGEPGDANFAAFMAEVVVDPRTGQIKLTDMLMAIDVGTILNPVAHQGQLDGGLVSGIGVALMEDLELADGRVVTATLGEYKLPTQEDVPPLRTVLVQTSVGPGPFGAKMSGEASTSGVAPAIANAVADAVGARVRHLPLTAERVRTALKDNARPSEATQTSI